MNLETLKAGDRFEVTGMPELKGEVLHVGPCGVRVRYDGKNIRIIEHMVRSEEGDTKGSVTIATDKLPVLISGGTVVTQL